LEIGNIMLEEKVCSEATFMETGMWHYKRTVLQLYITAILHSKKPAKRISKVRIPTARFSHGKIPDGTILQFMG
jgi:hypothetical protein